MPKTSKTTAASEPIEGNEVAVEEDSLLGTVTTVDALPPKPRAKTEVTAILETSFESGKAARIANRDNSKVPALLSRFRNEASYRGYSLRTRVIPVEGSDTLSDLYVTARAPKGAEEGTETAPEA